MFDFFGVTTSHKRVCTACKKKIIDAVISCILEFSEDARLKLSYNYILEFSDCDDVTERQIFVTFIPHIVINPTINSYTFLIIITVGVILHSF